MIDEISAAVLFLTRLIGKNENINPVQMEEFKTRLYALLVQRFENHWFPDKPFKGQGYRCIRLNEMDRRDPVLERAAQECGLKYEDLQLPVELTVWVDPTEVCCRFGEHKGSYCTVASFKEGNKENLFEHGKFDEKQNEYRERMKQDCIGPPKKCPKSTPFSATKYSPHVVLNNVRGQPNFPRHAPLHQNNSYSQYGTSSPNCFFFHINVNSTNSSGTLQPATGPVISTASGSPYGKIPSSVHGHSQRLQPPSDFTPRGTSSNNISHHRQQQQQLQQHNHQRNERYHWVNKSLIKT